MQPIPSELIHIENANDRIKYFHFQFDSNIGFHFKAGQFISVFMPSDPRPISRPYSIASTPKENSQGLLKLCVTAVPGGKVSNWLHSLKVGSRVNFKGPFGKFVLPDSVPEKLYFISVGTGIAPFRSMILDLYDRNISKEIYLFHGNRHEDSVLYDNDFQLLQDSHSKFHYFPCISRVKNSESFTGAQGYVQEKVNDVLGDYQEGQSAYICGINKMIDETCHVLSEKNFPKESVHFERYD